MPKEMTRALGRKKETMIFFNCKLAERLISRKLLACTHTFAGDVRVTTQQRAVLPGTVDIITTTTELAKMHVLLGKSDIAPQCAVGYLLCFRDLGI